MDTPTKKQTSLLMFIKEFTEENGYSPSYREIMSAMSLRSVSAVAEHVENCVAAGYLRKIPKSARSLEIIKPETHEDTVRLFHEKILALCNEEPDSSEAKILQQAAKILGLQL